jgi:cell division protein FtsI/penicillin-binding protein 2
VVVKDIIVQSSNIGMAQVAVDLKQEHVLESYTSMGFFRRTGIELPLELEGFEPYHYEQRKHEHTLPWPRITLANTGFGQGLAVTPLQLAMAYCVIANGGWRVKPTLVLQEDDPGPTETQSRPLSLPAGEILLTAYAGGESGAAYGETAVVTQPAGAGKAAAGDGIRVLSTETCDLLKEWLGEVVECGTGKAAKLDNFTAAGKTGTAQIPAQGGGYESGAYTASFVGFFPVDSPWYVVLVLFVRPRGEYYGGVVAAPVFKTVAERIVHLERCEPSEVPHAD